MPALPSVLGTMMVVVAALRTHNTEPQPGYCLSEVMNNVTAAEDKPLQRRVAAPIINLLGCSECALSAYPPHNDSTARSSTPADDTAANRA